MFTHSKRLVGGFYGYESGAEVKLLDVACAGKTDERGRLFCAVKPPVSGNIIMAAETKDRDGNLCLRQRLSLGCGQGRVVVRPDQRRPHRRDSRAKALRTGRDRAVAGAHAVPEGDRTDHDRARGRCRILRAAAFGNRAGGEGADQRESRAQCLRVGTGGARACRGSAADGDGGPGKAGFQDGHGGDQRRIARTRTAA